MDEQQNQVTEEQQNNVTEQEEQTASETRNPETDAMENDEMDDDDMDMDEMMEDEENFMALYEESFKRFEEGEVVTGKIIQIDKDYVLVDIGYKSEGLIPIREFVEPDGTVAAEIGDEVEVMVERLDSEDEGVMVSKEKASKIKVWEEIKVAYEEEGIVEGTITHRVKGGFSVDIGVPAFLPGSQVDLRPVRDLDSMVGKVFTFKVLKYNRKRSNIVLSRRVILEKEREEQRSSTLQNIHEGKVVEGVVKNITEYGVFVDLGGIDGLLHITDISWGRVKHPSELFGVGQTITVKVLDLDLERERVSLGMKQLKEDPWTTASDRYPVGERVSGKVVSLTDYGAFVELEEGIEGLIHVSEMSWTRKIRHPSKVVSVGDELEAVVLDIKPSNRRVSLGMKQVAPNPWDVIGEKYPIGTTIEGRIKNITDFGMFIGIDEGIDGLVHISDISWTKRINHPGDVYKKGDEVRAIVLHIDRENERFSLGIKQLEPDPWETISERYQVGTKVNGLITSVTDFGIFVELEEGIEGLVHVSEVAKEKVKTPVGQFNVGDTVETVVVNINPKERRIGLSIKRLEEDEQEGYFNEYMASNKPAASALGEAFQRAAKIQAQNEDNGDEE
ncbi:SSU ribosomal protein S1P [Desulfatibacillum alkenivorans DSM 16219]|jgi:small subunit ribosomal protein S1|uniref:Small ribosomal subunit protein bS1 n=1 Tax=Desulfatibacillum alkenivorans DSM 16219 TaxID=1121393 RepID=A0A1M6HTL1_9BACT|nr:30S ribosomal protein S1 [Desulfatibacillum alkenivorans]SHJ25552.1 SSU ribosomal protein S1P [Desulfatibacillum alkenivorans DSM 16219]